MDSRGFYELTLIGQDVGEAEKEIEEKVLGPEFDSYEDLAGDKLRLLDRYLAPHGTYYNWGCSVHMAPKSTFYPLGVLFVTRLELG